MKKIFLMSFSALIFSGCASIFSDSNYPIQISSEPEKADIKVFNEEGIQVYQGKTPATVELRAGEAWFDGKDYTVKFEKEGYLSEMLAIRRNLDTAYIVNFFVPFGFIGSIFVDPLTGAMWELESPVFVNLDKKQESKD